MGTAAGSAVAEGASRAGIEVSISRRYTRFAWRGESRAGFTAYRGDFVGPGRTVGHSALATLPIALA